MEEITSSPSTLSCLICPLLVHAFSGEPCWLNLIVHRRDEELRFQWDLRWWQVTAAANAKPGAKTSGIAKETVCLDGAQQSLLSLLSSSARDSTLARKPSGSHVEIAANKPEKQHQVGPAEQLPGKKAGRGGKKKELKSFSFGKLQVSSCSERAVQPHRLFVFQLKTNWAALKMWASWALPRVWHHEIHFSLIFSTIGADSCCGLRHSMARWRTVLVIVQQGR